MIFCMCSRNVDGESNRLSILLDIDDLLLFLLLLLTVETRHCIVDASVVHVAVSHRHGKRFVSEYSGDNWDVDTSINQSGGAPVPQGMKADFHSPVGYSDIKSEPVTRSAVGPGVSMID